MPFRTAFVADTTLGLSPEEALRAGIHLVPQTVILEGRAYRDEVELKEAELLKALRGGLRASTSQVAPKDLAEAYEELLKTHDRILSVHVSGLLSGTVATAMSVAQAFGARVKVLDSWNLNGGLHLVLEEARRLLRSGVAWERLEEAIAPYRARVRGLVLPETLVYLHRSGRIGGLRFFLGQALRVLPVLEVREGRVEAGLRVRGFAEGLKRMVARLKELFPEGARVHLAHAENPQGVERLRALLRVEGVEILSVRQAGAAVAAHAGPGVVGLFAGPRG